MARISATGWGSATLTTGEDDGKGQNAETIELDILDGDTLAVTTRSPGGVLSAAGAAALAETLVPPDMDEALRKLTGE